MKSIFIWPAILLVSFAATAGVDCKPKAGQAPRESAASFEFICGRGKNSFTAVCDITSDPLESGKGWIDVKVAKWTQQGDKQGIEGKFGFISCSKK